MKGTVLSVDDDSAVCDSIKRAFHKTGINLIATTDPVQGIKLAHEIKPDLILLDMDMPVLNGIGVLYELRANPALKAVPVIFISGNTDYRDKLAALQIGAVDWLPKPTPAAEIVARVRSHLQIQAAQRQLSQTPLPSDTKDV